MGAIAFMATTPADPYTTRETLHRDGAMALVRACREGERPVVLKVLDPRHCRPGDVERLRHEYAIETSLALPSIARPVALDTFEGMPALVLEDETGQPLDHLLGAPLPLERFLEIAVRVSGALADVHGQGVIHKDIKPGNILVHPHTREVKLTDFGIATRLPRERQEARPPELIEGSLPYMSPEQTGRMNRALDSRTDLYSLGVTFYQMLTGRLPFEARDPLEWIHCHVARVPASPSALVPQVPEAISLIVLRLLAKMAEERYQTARGLQRDLARCLDEWRGGGRIDPFPLGERDVPDRLQIPQKLYGRDEQVAEMLRAFERVLATGSPELALVSGAPGIGKSSLVQELHKPIVRQQGLFASGKFDQHARDVPYSTLVTALRDLVLGILTEGEDRIAAWRRRLEDALHGNAQLVVDVIPQVELVMGKQPPVPELPPTEAQNRFRAVFRSFIGAFAREGRPLALFLDDLQWADPASLALVQDVITNRSVRHLFIVGAYRDGEVTAAHPLTLTVDEARKAGARLSHIALGPLSRQHLAQFLADALRCRLHEAVPLAEVVSEKTAANPFFVIQFLTALDEERLIALDGDGRWRWDLARIRARGFTDNVVELVVGKLVRLPAAAQEALTQLACLGNASGVTTLSFIHGRSVEEARSDLWEALRGGLLVRLGDTYRFAHDRIQEAAYSLVPEASRPAAHLRIGRTLVAHLSQREVEERVFEVVSQLDRGIDLVTDAAEREGVCRLNALAGRKARASVAYASARSFLEVATSLLAPDAWSARYEEAFALHLELAECEYLAGESRRADAILEELLGRARSDLDRARVHHLRMVLYQGTGRFEEAWRSAVQGLALFGVSFPEAEAEITSALEAETRQIRVHLRGRRPADLVDATEMTSPDLRMVVRLLSRAAVVAYNARPECHALLISRAVRLSMLHGTTRDTGVLYGGYALVLLSLGDIAGAIEFGEAARRFAEKSRDALAHALAASVAGALVNHWLNPISTSVPLSDEAMRRFSELGELAHAGIMVIIAAWTVVVETGEPLDEALNASRKYLAFAEESRNEIARDAIRLIRQLVPALKGTTREPASFDDEGFSEAACLEVFHKVGFGAGLTLHRILKQISAFIYGKYDESLEAAEQQASAPAPASAFLYDLTHHFFRALAAAAIYPEADPVRQRRLRRLLQEELERHRLWAEQCPGNFLCRHALLSAEVARVEGRDLDAMRSYEEAIRSARENRYVQNEALAWELASRFYRTRGVDAKADTYLREARACYLRWGADRKVKLIDDILEPRPIVPTATFAVRAEQLDLLSVVKASQTISGQVEIEQLAGTLLQVALEQGGARKAYLVLARDGGLFIEAEASLEERGGASRILPSLEVATSALLPVSVLHRARRTREPVILDDASADAGGFGSDPYFTQSSTRSVLCLPIVRQDLAGLLYLENNLVAGAFTRDRLAALSLLATQAAISLENALLLARERAARSAAELLSEASVLLSQSLEVERTMGGLARLCVSSSLADWCEVHLVDGGHIRLLASACADPSREALLGRLRQRHPASWDSPRPAARCLREGKVIWLPEVSDELLRSLCDDDEHMEAVRALGSGSALAVPLAARGTTLGALSLASAHSGRHGRADVELAQEIARRAAMAVDNARLYREAQEAIRVREDFLSVASHELRTPAAGLMLSVDSLVALRGEQVTDPRTTDKLLDLLVRHGQRLRRLIGDLLDVSQIRTLSLEEIDLVAVVREVLNRLEPQLTLARCSVSFEARAPVTGCWDRSRLDQVITNLLSNAMKFGRGKPVEIALGTAGHCASLGIRDHGIGISPEFQPRLFGRFERGVSAEHYGGLGLGLYICRRIVEAHGGSIRVESQLGAGATFTVELPRAGPGAGPQASS